MKIIFVETHFDEKARNTLVQLLPVLRKHFDTFLDEVNPEPQLAEKSIEAINLYIDAVKNALANFDVLKDEMPELLPDTIAELEKVIADLPEKRRIPYLAQIHSEYFTLKLSLATEIEDKNLCEALLSQKYNYIGIDNRKPEEVSPIENQHEDREKAMVKAYFSYPRPALGRIGLGHAKSMQEKILKRLSIDDARKEFCFIYIHSNDPYLSYGRYLKSNFPSFYPKLFDERRDALINRPLTPLPIYSLDTEKLSFAQISQAILNFIQQPSCRKKFSMYQEINTAAVQKQYQELGYQTQSIKSIRR